MMQKVGSDAFLLNPGSTFPLTLGGAYWSTAEVATTILEGSRLRYVSFNESVWRLATFLNITKSSFLELDDCLAQYRNALKVAQHAISGLPIPPDDLEFALEEEATRMIGSHPREGWGELEGLALEDRWLYSQEVARLVILAYSRCFDVGGIV